MSLDLLLGDLKKPSQFCNGSEQEFTLDTLQIQDESWIALGCCNASLLCGLHTLYAILTSIPAVVTTNTPGLDGNTLSVYTLWFCCLATNISELTSCLASKASIRSNVVSWSTGGSLNVSR